MSSDSLSAEKARTAAVILNWQRDDLTLRCIDALLNLEGDIPDLYVVDNHSDETSVERIQSHLDGLGSKNPHRFVRETMGSHADPNPLSGSLNQKVRLVLIRSPKNLGFGGGINLGLRAALKDPDIRFVWVLNNDTLAEPSSLETLKRAFALNPRIGVLASALCYQDSPTILQGVGGRYQPWLGTTEHVLRGASYPETLASPYRPTIDYAIGAAVCIRREVLLEVGLFPEEYFLYFEDVDWALRVRKKAPHWKIDYCLESLVLHHEGASTGANQSKGKTTTLLADYFAQRNRLLLSRRWYPFHYPFVHFTQLGVFFNRLKRRHWHLSAIALGLFIGWIPERLKPESDRM